MTQQLRDGQAASERLRNQPVKVGCAHDHAELKLELYGSAPFTVFGRSKKVTQAQYIADEYPDLICRGGKIRCETLYPEVGAALNGLQMMTTTTRKTGIPVRLPLATLLSLFRTSAHPSNSMGPRARV
jgi:hypothetical protein